MIAYKKLFLNFCLFSYKSPATCVNFCSSHKTNFRLQRKLLKGPILKYTSYVTNKSTLTSSFTRGTSSVLLDERSVFVGLIRPWISLQNYFVGYLRITKHYCFVVIVSNTGWDQPAIYDTHLFNLLLNKTAIRVSFLPSCTPRVILKFWILKKQNIDLIVLSYSEYTLTDWQSSIQSCTECVFFAVGMQSPRALHHSELPVGGSRSITMDKHHPARCFC